MDVSPSKRVRRKSPSRKAETTDKMAAQVIVSDSPFLSIFQTFRAELDIHHDRRERIIKASRDVTALSKKMIFTLQRVPDIGSTLPQAILSDIAAKEATIGMLINGVYADLEGINAARYARQISPGMQEWMEACILRHYLVYRTLMSHREAQDVVTKIIGKPDAGRLLVEDDYLLGVFDAVGEMMRWCIGHLAVSRGSGTGDGLLVQDLRNLRLALEMVRIHGAGCERDVERKMETMQTCVEKVENVAYGLVVRGSERPAEWVPDDRGMDRQEVGMAEY